MCYETVGSWNVRPERTKPFLMPLAVTATVFQRVAGKVKTCGTPARLRGRIPLGFHASSLSLLLRSAAAAPYLLRFRCSSALILRALAHKTGTSDSGQTTCDPLTIPLAGRQASTSNQHIYPKGVIFTFSTKVMKAQMTIE